MSESLRTRLWRTAFNPFPAYRGTGARVTYIASDWREARVKLPLSWRTRNYVGTIYARFRLSEDDLDRLRALAPGEAVDREYEVDLISADGTVHAHVEKTVYVRRDE